MIDVMASSELLNDYRSMDHFILKLMRFCERCHTVLTYLGTILCVFSIAKDGMCGVPSQGEALQASDVGGFGYDSEVTLATLRNWPWRDSIPRRTLYHIHMRPGIWKSVTI